MNLHISHLIALPALLLSGCSFPWGSDGGPADKLRESTTYYYLGTQCADPWQVVEHPDYCDVSRTEASEPADQLEAFLDYCLEMDVEDVKAELHTYGMAACMACSCTDGMLYTAEFAYLSAAQADKLVELGFTKEKPDFSSHPKGELTLYYQATKCADPWMYGGDDPCYSDAAEAQYAVRMYDYLQCMNLSLDFMQLVAQNEASMCEACNCTSGNVYAVGFTELSQEQRYQLLQMGFEESEPSSSAE